MTYKEEAEKIVNSQYHSFWLKDAVMTLQRRDPVDAMSDVEHLLMMCQLRCDDCLKAITPKW